jgi:hypothetical protein
VLVTGLYWIDDGNRNYAPDARRIEMALAVADDANTKFNQQSVAEDSGCTRRLANTVLLWWLNLGDEPSADGQAE